MTGFAETNDAGAASAIIGRRVRSLLATVLLAGTALLSLPSHAQFLENACIVARGGNSCTANEGGAITATPVACDALTAGEIALNTNGCLTPAAPSCIANTTVPIKILVGLAQNNADRYDVGVYISTDANKPLNVAAPTGAATCGVAAVPIPPGTALDPNTCGDQPAQTALADSIPLSTSIVCTAGTGGNLAIQLGASYSQSKGTATSCSYLTAATQLAPGTGSKCNTNTATVPIQVITPAASVTLVKALVPGADPGLFNLSIASNPPAGPASTAANQTDGGSVTRNGITPGTVVTLSETAGTGTDLNNYTSTLACVRTDNQQSVPVTNNTTITMPTPEVGIVCTLTNTRKGRSVQVIKDVVPNGDSGLFNLLVNGTSVRTDAGDGDSGTRTGVPVGSEVTVNETAGSGTSLGNYGTSLLCTGATPTGTTPGTFTMPDANVVCTYTNTRKSYTVTLVKALSPTDDPGLFDLRINGQTVADDVGNGGSGSTSVIGGTAVTVSELAGPDTSLGNYTTQLSCTGAQESGTNPGSFTMPDNDVTCTYTNTRIVIPVVDEVPVPTLSTWMLMLLGLMLAGTAWVAVRRR